jgi:hypothetical protein
MSNRDTRTLAADKVHANPLFQAARTDVIEADI